MVNSPMDPHKIVIEMDASQRIIVYCIGALGKPIEDKVEIQKILFLSMMALPDIFNGLYTFQKHKKGPYSEKIDEDVQVICNSGLISGHFFGLSYIGQGVYNEIEPRVKEPLKSTLLSNKEFASDLSDDELLTFIYAVFPEYTENSEVWDGLKKDRVKNAISLLKKGKITASCAADIADMNYYEFEENLRKQKIRWKS